MEDLEVAVVLLFSSCISAYLISPLGKCIYSVLGAKVRLKLVLLKKFLDY